MGFLPDWNSVESTARWSDGLFWAGIVALILLAATEVASHILANRSADLVSVRVRAESETRNRQEQETEQRHTTETAQIQQRLTEADAELNKLRSQQIERHLTPSQRQELIRALLPYAGQKITVWCSSTAWDSAAFAATFWQRSRKPSGTFRTMS